MPERTFNLYNKSGTKVASGKSPLQLLDLVEDTDYKKGDYTITAQEYSSESTHVDVPAFRTKVTLKLTIEGVETTGTYLTKDISQAGYLALATKDANTLYRVQPTDSGSGRVHFLGDKIVDLTKKGDTPLYSRNLIMNTKSTGVTRSATNAYGLSIITLVPQVDVVYGEVIAGMFKAKNTGTGTDSGFWVSFFQQSKALGEASAGAGLGESTPLTQLQGTVPQDITAPIYFRYNANSASNLNLIGYCEKVIKGTKDILLDYTVAPEDMLTVTGNSGGGTFG